MGQRPMGPTHCGVTSDWNETLTENLKVYIGYDPDVTPFFSSESYESCLAASVSWQEDCEHHDEKEKTAFA